LDICYVQEVEISGYELTGRLGEGGMAEVFLARRPGVEGFSKQLALKCMREDLSESADALARFVQEAKVSAELEHPHIVHVFELLRDRGRLVIAMEYVRGATLAMIRDDFVARGEAFGVPRALAAVLPVLEALDYAHGSAARIVHRDVSPENVLVSDEGVVKLSDFGIAKIASGTIKTRTGRLHGKFGYLAPEQARGQPADAAADVFAVAVMLYELLAGARLYEGATPEEVLAHARLGPAKSLDPARAPRAVCDVLARALSTDPTRRFHSALAFLEALQATGAPVAKRAELGVLASALRKEPAPIESKALGAIVQQTPFAVEDDAPNLMMSHTSLAEVTRRVAAPAKSPRQGILWAVCLSLSLGIGAVLFVVLSRARVPEPPTPQAQPVTVLAPTREEPLVIDPVAPVRAQLGNLSLNAHPWGHVFIDGKAAGSTPIVSRSLAVGEHAITVVSHRTGQKKHLLIRVDAGQTVTRLIEFGP
jgi:tRNA A-37 threonylcarbamoyl transferase component Bud32